MVHQCVLNMLACISVALVVIMKCCVVSAGLVTCSGILPMVYRNDKIPIKDFGGVGDGRTLNTKMFNEAVYRIKHLKRRGGTLLYVPKGVDLTESFNLTSRMTLYLAKGAVIKATKNIANWPLIAPLPSYGRGRECPGGRYMSFIHGENVHDVIITGEKGTIDGQGGVWWNMWRQRTLQFTRPNLIEFKDSRNIIISNVIFKNSPFWNIHPVYCSHVVIHHVTILAPPDSPNTDGIDPGVVLLVSPCGYSMSDSPTVQIWTSNKIHKEERSCVGKWEVRSLITSAPKLCGPEESGSVSFKKNTNLLSLDEHTLSGMGSRASIAGTSKSNPCIHAKRFIVTGCVVKEDIGRISSQNYEHASSIRNWLEKAPLLNRYKVPVESEKLIDNDLVLEQNISPASPVMAGFHLDGFSAIKPQLTHSPYSTINSQGSSDEMVVVGEYKIPEVKSGTPMYFDFPKIISSQRVWFKLVGDVTWFADDPEDGEGGRPLAAGLSLLNRIKLYYYAYPSELRRWASISGI